MNSDRKAVKRQSTQFMVRLLQGLCDFSSAALVELDRSGVEVRKQAPDYIGPYKLR